VAAAAVVAGGKGESEEAWEREEKEEDADGAEDARESRREAACGEGGGEDGEAETNVSARRERQSGETRWGGRRRRKRRERSGRESEAGRRRSEETWAGARRLRNAGEASAGGQVEGGVWCRMSARSLTMPEWEVVGVGLASPAMFRRGGGGIRRAGGEGRRSP
jgi:hypothetical protein